MQTVFVAEIVPSQNKGEAALMWGIVRSIREQANEDVKFYLCSETYEEDAYEYKGHVEVVDHPGLVPVGESASWKLKYFILHFLQHLFYIPFYYLFGKYSLLIFRDKLWKAYCESDVIVVGHDNAFSKFHIPLIIYSKLLRKKVAVYGSTIMPVVLNTDFVRKLGRWALNKVDLITTRENLTYEHLVSIGVNKVPLYCTADKAFILEETPKDEVSKMCDELGLTALTKPVIGVMIVKGSTVFKAAFKDQNLSPEEKYDKHISEIAKSMDVIAEKLKATLVFMPHCIGPGDNLDDRVCARHVHEKMTRKDQVVLLEDKLRVPELKGILGTFDMVISERTHGGINAASMKIPTLWISHPRDHRTYGIVSNTLKLPQCLYNIENLEAETLTDKILEIYETKDEVVRVLDENIPIAQELSMSNGKHFKRHVIDGEKLS